MNVLCSGELYKEPIDHETCLDCSLRLKQPPCGYGYRLLKAMFSTFQDRSREIHVTDITTCLLKAYLTKTEEKPEYVHHRLLMFLGIAVHKSVDVTDSHVLSEKPVRRGDLIGRVDAIYGDGDIEDVKTTRWLKPSNGPYGEHETQLNIYRLMLGSDKNMRVQMIDLSGPTKCRSCKVPARLINGVTTCPVCGKEFPDGHLGATIVSVDTIDDIEELVDERVGILKAALDMGVPPKAEPGWICGYCPHTSCEYNKNEGE